MKNYFEKYIHTVPVYKDCPEFMPTGEFEGIRAITYDGATFCGKKTKFFAYFGFPKKCSGKVPAMVLVSGGNGPALVKWVKLWNDRGYAAISVSVGNLFPKVVNAGFEESWDEAERWEQGLYGTFLETGYVSAPGNDEMKQSEKPVEEQWIYHAISATILADSLLRNEARIDTDKIGIMGISWGGVITSLVMGIDKRFAFAIPVYGSGYLAEGEGHIGSFIRTGRNTSLWLAEDRFSEVKIPVLWQCWNKDAPFSINSNSKSYLDTVKNNSETRLSIVHEMYHSHACGWVREEPYLFADSICKETKRAPYFVAQSEGFTLENPDDVPITECRVYYLTEPFCYTHDTEKDAYALEAEWQVLLYEGTIPPAAKAYYLEAISEIDGKEFVTTSPFVMLEEEKN